MAIGAVPNISQLMASLRQQMGTQRPNEVASPVSGRQIGAAGTSVLPNASQGVDVRKDVKTLEKKLRARIGKLGNSENPPLEASVNAFMECVLVAEFGDELAQDPKFNVMLDDLVKLVLDDDGLRGQFAKYFAQNENAV